MKSLLRSILFLLFTLLSLPLWAQDDEFRVPDSLMAKLKEFRGTDLKRAKALDDVIMFYFDEHKITDAAGYINDLVDVANNIRDNYWMAKSHYYKSLCAYENYDNTEFLIHINEAQRITETLRENEISQLLLARIYLAKSAVYFRNNLFPECQENIDKGMAIVEKWGFDKQKKAFLCNIGALLMRLEKYDDAIVAFKTNLTESFNLKLVLNIASSYRISQQYDSAFYYADSVIRYVNRLEKMNADDGYQLISAYQVKAVGYMDLGLWDLAIDNLDAAEDNMGKFGDKSLFATGLLDRADALNGLKQYDLALGTINDAIDVAKLAGLVDVEWYAVKLKSDILENMGAYEQEVENLRYFNVLTDTINNRENVEKVQMLKYQKETLSLEQQYENQKAAMQQRHIFIILLLTFLLVVGSLVIVIIMLNRKRKLETTAAVLDTRNREVTSKTMEQIHLNQVLQDVVTKLTYFSNNPKDNPNAVESAIRELKNIIDDGSEKDFDFYFTQVHPDFYRKLQADFPNLTANDLRLCAYIKNNLNVKDVAEMTGISADSVKAARSRLRRKLGISNPNDSLFDFLSKY